MTEVKEKSSAMGKKPSGNVATLDDFATSRGIPVTKLVTQLTDALQAAGEKAPKIKPTDPMTPELKQALLGFLSRKPAAKITLKRSAKISVSKPSSEEHVVGRGTKVRVVRKRTLSAPPQAPQEEAPAAQPVLEEAIEEAAVLPTPVVKTAVEEVPEKKDQEAQPALVVPETQTAPQSPSKDKKPVKKKTKKDGDFQDDGLRRSRRSDAKGKRGLSSSSLASERAKKKRKADQNNLHAFEKPTVPVIRDVTIPETITVSELAQRMAVKGAAVVKTLFSMGVMATINQSLDQDTAVLVVEEMGHKPKLRSGNEIEENLAAAIKQHGGEKQTRPPVVTIMGHVDHGKTSLLDYIRRAKVANGEAGGITQHIGAYSVSLERGKITFLDTPGHAAFSAMRARGANCTDLVILVVAADDGVMPQTIEAIVHAKASKVPVIVAVNKIDKEKSDIDRIKTEVSKHELIPEDWGGDTQFVPVSAKTGEGVDPLLDAILLQSEMLELKAISDCPAQGVVVESQIDKGRGVIATVLVQQGTLKKGDILLAGQEFGRVRALIDENAKSLETVGPSGAAEVLGLSGAPQAGDEIVVVRNEKKAREIAVFRQNKARQQKLAKQQALKKEGLFTGMQQTGEVKTLKILLKADVQGSLEALNDALLDLGTDEVKIEIVAAGIGGINESDINLALSSSAEVIGFNVRADAKAKKLAQEEAIKMNYYSVIYELIDNIKIALGSLLAPEVQEKILGVAAVRDVFHSSKWGGIAGCRVIEGVIRRNNPIRVLRSNTVIYEGELESLRRFKEDVNEVRLDMECGIGVKNYNDVKVGDEIEVFEKILIQRKL